MCGVDRTIAYNGKVVKWHKIMTEDEVLRAEENGVEFFTVVATGESAVSERGLARMCGVDHKAIRHILGSIGEQKSPKMLENLVGQDLYLGDKIVKNGKEIKAIKVAVAARIIHYYDRKGNTTAQATADAIVGIGLTSYIHTKTEWLAERYTAAPEQHQILDEYFAWEGLYETEMCKKVFSWFGTDFYWDFCYQWMTPEERGKVNRLNPIVGGKRARKVHQYLDEDTRRRLTPSIETLGVLLKSSDSRQDFLSRYRRVYGSERQMELLKHQTPNS